MPSKYRIAAGLDVGSSRTRCVVCAIEDLSVRLIGYGDVPSRGWQRGRIADQDAVSLAIREAIGEAENKSGEVVESVVAGLGGAAVDGLNSRGLYEFGRPREIVAGDLGYAVELAARLRLQDDRILLQVCPQDFTIDGRAGYRNPKGVTCSRLEANVHLITASAHDHQSLISAIHQAHVAVEETIFEPVAAAYAAIVQQDRARGVALIDIGANSSDVVVYDGEALLLAASLPISAEHFTKDVVHGLNVSYEDADKLKREYGCALLGLTADNTLIEIPTLDGRAAREASRKMLNIILEARAEDLFTRVQQLLVKVNMEQALLEGIVLTGGGSLLNGMCDMAERVLNCQCRNGLPIGIIDWPDEINDGSWTTAAGLSMYSARLKIRKDTKKKAPGFMGFVLR